MQTITKKAIAGIVTLTTIILVSGTVLLAQDQAPGDVISTSDLAFIQAAPTGISTEAAGPGKATSTGLVTSAGQAFIAQPYTQIPGNQKVATATQSAGIITAADYQFVTKGHISDVFALQDDLAESLAGNQAE